MATKFRYKPDGTIALEDDAEVPAVPPSANWQKVATRPQPAVIPQVPTAPPMGAGPAARSALGSVPAMGAPAAVGAAIGARAPQAAPQAPAYGGPVGQLPDLYKMMGVKQPPATAPTSPNMPPPIPDEGFNPVRARDEMNALAKEKYRMTQGPTEQRDIGRIDQINQRMGQLTRILRGQAKPTTEQEAVGQINDINNKIRSTVAQQLSVFDAAEKAGAPLSAQEVAERQRLRGVLEKYSNISADDVRAQALARVSESLRTGSRQNAEYADAASKEEVRRSQLRFALEQQRKQVGQAGDLADAQAAADLAGEQARGKILTAQGGAAELANNPDLAKSKAATDLAIAEANRLRALQMLETTKGGNSPEVTDLKQQQRDAALRDAGVVTGNAAKEFERLMPSLQQWVSQGGLVDTISGLPTGTVSSVTGLGTDSPMATLGTLEQAIAPLEVAAAKNPEAARLEARAILRLFPPSATGKYEGAAPIMLGGFTGQIAKTLGLGDVSTRHGALAERLNSLRERVQKLAQ